MRESNVEHILSGNAADINFRGVIERCLGLVVAAAPQPVVSERQVN